MMELGSEYHLDLSDLSVKTNTVFQRLSEYAYTCYFDSGRSALRHLASFFNSGEEILLPEFICDSVIRCFPKEAVRFYRLHSDFSIDLKDLEAQFNTHTRWVFLIHYFGSLQAERVLCTMKALSEYHHCLLIEDTTHSLFSRTGTIGDYQVCSIRKWLPIPSGGVLYSRNDELGALHEVHYEVSAENTRAYGMVLKELFLKGKLDCNAEYRRIFSDCECALNQQKHIMLMSDFARFIASCTDTETLRRTRIENHRQLREALKEIGLSPAVHLNDEECPLVLPVWVKERDRLRHKLMENRVYCAVHWPFDGMQQERRTFAQRCARHLISLPIDQRYGKNEIDFLIDVIRRCGEDLLC